MRQAGLSAPDAFRFNGESIDYVSRCPFDGKVCGYKLLNGEIVQRLAGDDLEGRDNGQLFVWSLLHLAFGCEQFR